MGSGANVVPGKHDVSAVAIRVVCARASADCRVEIVKWDFERRLGVAASAMIVEVITLFVLPSVAVLARTSIA